ncbi:PD-(D/E)XK nuclease-like domain-containing protein [Bifidobacterium platyrrhinorum]|uniref:Putative exodeoxyribonuclease 8 PDDEXK-like domain-containing protein n=1 Tax=Bifidobacterium platyrrhinorum TaxID=2661628 RepID=A0A6L9STJ4_9BIFI|nr:PD-(D/E)XK nuclease-like domain-containing protein [Bifidobacterium platyrrhinorum]NEG55409.1 hypothetical protein [Bifidobacterium platyrrhinorum]
MEPRIDVMPDKEYFADPALDQSALKQFLVCPAAFVDFLDNGIDVAQRTLDVGSAAHSLVLGEGPNVEVRLDGRTKEGKQQLADLDPDETILLSQTDYDMVHGMADRCDWFRSHAGVAEVALFATDPETGLELKAKLDWLPSFPDYDGVLRLRDYKTHSGNLDSFGKTAKNLGYIIQAVFYQRMYRWCAGYEGPLDFEFIVQSKKRPYLYRPFCFNPKDYEWAGMLISHALRRIKAMRDAHPDDWKTVMAGQGLAQSPEVIEFNDWEIPSLEVTA